MLNVPHLDAERALVASCGIPPVQAPLEPELSKQTILPHIFCAIKMTKNKNNSVNSVTGIAWWLSMGHQLLTQFAIHSERGHATLDRPLFDVLLDESGKISSRTILHNDIDLAFLAICTRNAHHAHR